jgi:tRNA nucleotidyltransferase (CCA-adding enzyme)
MMLPEYVTTCLNALENAGFPAYCVGGCVRDHLLGLTPNDYDICTAALPEQTEAVFSGYPLVLTGKQHGTVSVVFGEEAVEITTFRTEGQYLDNRHPEWVRFVATVEEDLARRDFTVNAMAYSPKRGFADPFGGREDLDKKILRAVGDPVQRFREDSLRILRGLRFAARFDLAVEEATWAAMVSEKHLTDNLARERVFAELNGLLPRVTAADLIRFAPVLAVVIPELESMIGFDQRSPHHAYDVFTHTAYVVENVSPVLPLRWAALLHDVGKVPTFAQDETGRGHFKGHAAVGAEMADVILRRLKAPRLLWEQVVFLIGKHMTKLKPEKKYLRRYISQLGMETVNQLLLLQEADMGSKGKGKPEELCQFAILRTLLREIEAENPCLSLKNLAVDGHDLTELGIRGKAIGETLNRLLEKVMDEELPNEKAMLLHSVKKTM